MNPAQLTGLCRELSQEFRRDPKGARVASMLAAYGAAHEDWRGWALFDADAYTRNLVHHEEHFELLILCWQRGQKSPIHNHQGQRCWMAVLDGSVRETLFQFPTDSTATGTPLVAGNSRVCGKGQVAFITDDIALHEIASANDAPAVSLHLYSKPFTTCQVYDRDSGRVELRKLSYTSVRGERVATARV